MRKQPDEERHHGEHEQEGGERADDLAGLALLLLGELLAGDDLGAGRDDLADAATANSSWLMPGSAAAATALN